MSEGAYYLLGHCRPSKGRGARKVWAIRLAGGGGVICYVLMCNVY